MSVKNKAKAVKYDTKSAKECVLSCVREAYLAMGTTNRDVDYDEELVCGAMFKVLEEDKHNHEQYLELLAASRMLQGITLHCSRGKYEVEKIDDLDELPF